MEFTDRVFLGNYSLTALAAATPAGITSFLFTAFFLGVAGYVNVFIAQYTGARDHGNVGASLWQGIYFALLGAVFMAILSTIAKPLFACIGHPPEVQALEVIYFRILCLGAGASIAGNTLSSFFSGRGLTRPVMIIHMAGTLFNIPLDYALINGLWGLPELGITGAALATVAAWCFIALCFAALVFTRANDKTYQVRRNRRFNPALFKRLMTFGIPGGMQFSLDILVFTFFILMVGRIGKTELAVTNLVMSINGLSYMPMFGLSMGVSTLVGQAMGSRNPREAVLSARATVHIATAYVGVLILVFLLLPAPLIKLFLAPDTLPREMDRLISMGTVLLRFVSVYLLFDSLVIIYTGVLKGAGDSRFIMWSMVSTGITCLFIPIWLGINTWGMGLYFSWCCITFYLMVLFIVVVIRYNNGKWKEISMIQPTTPSNWTQGQWYPLRPDISAWRAQTLDPILKKEVPWNTQFMSLFCCWP